MRKKNTRTGSSNTNKTEHYKITKENSTNKSVNIEKKKKKKRNQQPDAKEI